MLIFKDLLEITNAYIGGFTILYVSQGLTFNFSTAQLICVRIIRRIRFRRPNLIVNILTDIYLLISVHVKTISRANLSIYYHGCTTAYFNIITNQLNH